eukprot:2234407-Pyramimonas_sp.AAC.1
MKRQTEQVIMTRNMMMVVVVAMVRVMVMMMGMVMVMVMAMAVAVMVVTMMMIMKMMTIMVFFPSPRFRIWRVFDRKEKFVGVGLDVGALTGGMARSFLTYGYP